MKRDGREGAVNLLRICTICLAAVSFWATAKGMTKYVFSEKWQAYAASLAIQGILLGMNFYMPIFLKDLDKVWKRFILGFLTAIVILCSSWFSYLYIVDKVYEDSWNTERYLLTEEVYRQTLYEGNAYAEEYKMMLGEQLPETITDIYDLARTIRTSSNEETKESSENSQEFNWEKEREDYCKDNFDGKELMSEAIDGMEQAMQDKEDVGTRNATVKSLENIQENFKIKIDELTEESIEADENVKKAQKTLDDMKKMVILRVLVMQTVNLNEQ